jgi:hypothetical protein
MRSRARTTRPAAEPGPHHSNREDWQQQMEKNRALVELVESWLEEDSERDPKVVQAEWEEFKSALDAGRLSDGRLFP